MQSNVKVMLK